jgi:hypothetical protein
MRGLSGSDEAVRQGESNRNKFASRVFNTVA